MVGIFGGYNVSDYQFSLSEQSVVEGFTYGRFTLNKFEGERFDIENNDLICQFEGFLFDIDGFENQKAYFEHNLQRKELDEFLSELDGIFSFSVYFKKEQRLVLAVDHLASYKMFYTIDDERMVFSSDLFDVSKFLKLDVKDDVLDLDSVYYFLGFGSVVAEKTLFKSISKLEAGSYLNVDLSSMKFDVVKYHELSFDKKTDLDESQIVDEYQRLLVKPMKRIASLNSKYNLDNIAGLSGGLDSKSMVVMMNELVGSKLTSFTFAEYGSLDQKIAQKVSSSLSLMHVFTSLDKGNCLKYSFEEAVKASNGLVAIHTLLHGFNSFKNIDAKRFGLLLTGQIGDAIFGSHFIGNKTIKQYITSKSHYATVPEFIFKKIGYIDELLDSYVGRSEAYIYYGRISNGTMYGDIVNRDKIDTITPFYSRKLLEFTLTVPDQYRKEEYIYLKWLKKYYPAVMNFKWDKSNCNPTSQLKVKIFRKIYVLKSALKKRLKLKYDGMNPFDVWFRESPDILKNLDNKFEANISLLSFNPQLKKDVERLYSSDVDRYKRNKFTALTLLLSLKMHLGEGCE